MEVRSLFFLQHRLKRRIYLFSPLYITSCCPSFSSTQNTTCSLPSRRLPTPPVSFSTPSPPPPSASPRRTLLALSVGLLAISQHPVYSKRLAVPLIIAGTTLFSGSIFALLLFKGQCVHLFLLSPAPVKSYSRSLMLEDLAFRTEWED